MKNKIIVLGDNIVSHYFKKKEGYDVFPLSWFYEIENSLEIIKRYKAIIYTEEKRNGFFSDLLETNVSIPKDILGYLKGINSPVSFFYISTAEFYNGNYEWENNSESLTHLNTSNDYLLTKRIGERILEEYGALILRIKNPFSEYYHPDNWLVNLVKREEPFNWIDCHTYLPDLEKAITFLLKEKSTGIYNCVQTETASELYYLQLIGVEKFKDIDIHFYETPVENDNGSDINSSKLKNLIDLEPMNFAVLYSAEKLKNNLDNSSFKSKIEVCE